MPIKDVIVNIDLATPAPRVGLGRILVLTEAVGTPSYKEYSSLEAIAADYPDGSAAHSVAETIFMQKDRPDVVAIATYETGAPEAALNAFYERAWHFVLLANDVAADQLKVSNLVEAKDFKFFGANVKDNTGREALKGKKRTIVFHHPVVGENLAAAAIATLGSREVGSITWKFKGGFAGVTAQYMIGSELAEVEADNALAYLYKAGKPQLSNGIDASGEYVDALHGKDFVKVDMENEIQYALQNADKVIFDNRGIGLITGAATTTLQRAYNQTIVAQTDDGLPDYEITALRRDEVDPGDRANRVYKGLSFRFSNAGAIHEVEVKGQIIQ